jgi:hypothetical protein
VNLSWVESCMWLVKGSSVLRGVVEDGVQPFV